MKFLLAGLFVPLVLLARPSLPILPPESPRVMGMGGSYVAVANDPEAAFLNPAGLIRAGQIGSDQAYGETTNDGTDKIILAYINPSSEENTSFGTGMWTEAQFHPRKFRFYVPFVGLPWRVSESFSFGAVLRAPARISTSDSNANVWAVVGDIGFYRRGQNLNFGGMLERAIGGEADMIPRRMRLGTSWISDNGDWTLAYEWQAEQTDIRYHFDYQSSHLGLEIITGKYAALRGGYVWADKTRYTMGLAVGNLKRGWRIESAFSLPTSGEGETVWSAGLAYRL